MYTHEVDQHAPHQVMQITELRDLPPLIPARLPQPATYHPPGGARHEHARG